MLTVNRPDQPLGVPWLPREQAQRMKPKGTAPTAGRRQAVKTDSDRSGRLGARTDVLKDEGATGDMLSQFRYAGTKRLVGSTYCRAAFALCLPTIAAAVRLLRAQKVEDRR